MSNVPKATRWSVVRRGKQVERARIRLPLGNGRYDYRILGSWGEHEEAEKKVVAEWMAKRTGGHSLPKARHGITMAELVEMYLVAAQTIYPHRPIGENDHDATSKQFRRVKRAMAFPLRLYAGESLADFGPLKLKACREIMVQDGLCRQYCNCLTACIIRVFRWAAEEELVDASVHANLVLVSPLKKRRTMAPEGPGTPATVPWEVIEKTLVHLSPMVRAMVLVQYNTCMRPAEVCILKKDRIRPDAATVKLKDGQKVKVWAYYPGAFKGDHSENTAIQEVVPLGPKSVAALSPFWSACQDGEYLFQPIQAERVKASVGVHYTPHSYCQAVKRGCERAGVPVWTPRQLRHTHSTAIRNKYASPEYSQAALRHKHVSTSEIYAKIQTRRAFTLAAREG